MLPGRALRHWTAALKLTDRAVGWLVGGVGELRRVSGVGPIGTAADLVTALDRAVDGVRHSTASVVELRRRIDEATSILPDPAAGAALTRWREGTGVLDELTGRMQQGCAALSAYADGVFGVDPIPDRAQRPPVPAHLRVPFRRQAAWRSWRGFWASGGSWTFRPHTDAMFFDDCLRTTLLLGQGNSVWYADRLDLFRRAKVLDGYADALAAGTVVAVDRRLTQRRDTETVRRLATRMHQRYDGGTGEVAPDAAEGLIRAALGEAPAPAVDQIGLTLMQTLLLVDLLGDEQPTRDDRAAFQAAFRAEAVELALLVGPARLAAAIPAGSRRRLTAPM